MVKSDHWLTDQQSKKSHRLRCWQPLFVVPNGLSLSHGEIMNPLWLHIFILQSIFLSLIWHVVFSSLSEYINIVLKMIKANCNSLCSHSVYIPKWKEGKQRHDLTVFPCFRHWKCDPTPAFFPKEDGWVCFSYIYKSTDDKEKADWH